MSKFFRLFDSAMRKCGGAPRQPLRPQNSKKSREWARAFEVRSIEELQWRFHEKKFVKALRSTSQFFGERQEESGSALAESFTECKKIRKTFWKIVFWPPWKLRISQIVLILLSGSQYDTVSEFFVIFVVEKVGFLDLFWTRGDFPSEF